MIKGSRDGWDRQTLATRLCSLEIRLESFLGRAASTMHI
jgi:hypothetical protein